MYQISYSFTRSLLLRSVDNLSSKIPFGVVFTNLAVSLAFLLRTRLRLWLAYVRSHKYKKAYVRIN